ncbi:hypothetical protein OCU04_002234 [Sclerotinia nivalis]|uniref:Uncharacterized protein n=1 Tax=Sclerotinia nivalis TaxID=352851 RepID=A0A9X0AZP5_9HELO|nr:hypothetical protein OCU04_002234 [Sclerotinia nivalis]
MTSGSTSINNAIPTSIEGIRTEIQRVFDQWPTITQILIELNAPVMPNLVANPNEQIVYLNHIFFIIEDRFTIQAIYIATQTNKIEEFKTENVEFLRTLTGLKESFSAFFSTLSHLVNSCYKSDREIVNTMKQKVTAPLRTLIINNSNPYATDDIDNWQKKFST